MLFDQNEYIMCASTPGDYFPFGRFCDINAFVLVQVKTCVQREAKECQRVPPASLLVMHIH
jgi:hypothetical protein